MNALTALDRAQRDGVRLRFFREYRGAGGCASVSVRTDKQQGVQYLSVGVAAEAHLPSSYDGLEVRTYEAPAAMHAVQYRNA